MNDKNKAKEEDAFHPPSKGNVSSSSSLMAAAVLFEVLAMPSLLKVPVVLVLLEICRLGAARGDCWAGAVQGARGAVAAQDACGDGTI
jgi:hypothetical protein